NASGLPIHYRDRRRIVIDQNGNEYMLDVTEMRSYLKDSYGPPENLARTDDAGGLIPRFLIQGMLWGRKGVIAFGGRHIDLWDGAQIHGQGYDLPAIWEAVSALRDGVFFWDVGQ